MVAEHLFLFGEELHFIIFYTLKLNTSVCLRSLIQL